MGMRYDVVGEGMGVVAVRVFGMSPAIADSN